MKTRSLALATCIVLLCAGAATAQHPAESRVPTAPPSVPDVSLSDLKPTPEMWFYLQERQRYDNPKNAVRRNAELEAARRSDRIAALQWYGVSTERPHVANTVFGGLFFSPIPADGPERWSMYYSVRTTHPQPPAH